MTKTDLPHGFESKPCPLGCPENDEPLFDAPDRLIGKPGTFSVVRCLGCGLIRTNPRPSPALIQDYYPEDYGPYVATRIETSSRGVRHALRKSLRPLVRWIVRDEFLPSLPPGRLLEIGCASGSFLASMSSKGWSVRGIEPSPTAAAAARASGLSVETGSIETADAPSESTDLVVAWMVLEHLHDPVKALRQLHRWSTSDAWLVASTPNADSIDFRWFRDCGFALQLPTHLYHYTPRTLTQVLRSGGWEVQRVIHQRSEMNLLASLGYRLEEQGWPKSISNWFRDYPEKARWSRLALQPLAQLLGITGNSGRMTIWARKLPVDALPNE